MSIRRWALAGALTAAATVAVAVPASAGTVDKGTAYAAVRGHIELVRDNTTWDFMVSKRQGDTCVYAKVTVEVVNFPGHEYRSGKICPSDPWRSVDFRGTAAHSFSRAARVELCREVPLRPDHCEQVWSEPPAGGGTNANHLQWRGNG
jgi:hypothetical protein